MFNKNVYLDSSLPQLCCLGFSLKFIDTSKKYTSKQKWAQCT